MRVARRVGIAIGSLTIAWLSLSLVGGVIGLTPAVGVIGVLAVRRRRRPDLPGHHAPRDTAGLTGSGQGTVTTTLPATVPDSTWRIASGSSAKG